MKQIVLTGFAHEKHFRNGSLDSGEDFVLIFNEDLRIPISGDGLKKLLAYSIVPISDQVEPEEHVQQGTQETGVDYDGEQI